MSHKCPFDENALRPVTVEHGVAAVCQKCHGIWLPAEAMRSLVASLREGWTGYSTLPVSAKSGGACPTDQKQMTVYEQYGHVIEQCRECGGLWLPGAALLAETRRSTGYDDPIFFEPDEKWFGKVAVAVGIDPQVVESLLTASIGIWLGWPWFE